MQLTTNIWRHELACHCGCGFDSADWETVNVVQECCDHFADQMGAPKVVLRILEHSAARCFKHNRKEGSNDGSQHPLARAIDFSIDGVSPADVYAYLVSKYPNKHGIGRYKTFTHLDTRSGPKARWRG